MAIIATFVITELLLKLGASPNVRNDCGTKLTPLELTLELLKVASTTNERRSLVKQALLLLSCAELDVTNQNVDGGSVLETAVLTCEPRIILAIIKQGHSSFRESHVLSALLAMDHFSGTRRDKHQLIKLLLAELPPSQLEPNLECQFAALMLPHDDLTRRLIVRQCHRDDGTQCQEEASRQAFNYLAML